MKPRLDSLGFGVRRENHGRAWQPIPHHIAQAACRNRHGALLLELIICGMILGVVVSAMIPTLAWLARERQGARQRQMALLEVGNLMERLSLLEWDDLTSEQAAKVEFSESVRGQLPEAHWTVTVTGDDAVPKAKHVFIELGWTFAPGRPTPPVRLAAWVHHNDK